MQMSAEHHFTASPETVWAALNDVETLRLSIPGCERLEWETERTLAAQVRAKVGPVDSRFHGQVTLSDVDPPKGYRLAAEARGGAAGFASGVALVRLSPDGAGTLLRWEVDATVGGRLAQVGSRLIAATARKLADDFFERFTARVAPRGVDAEDEPAPVARRDGLRPAVWVPAMVVAVVCVLVVFSRL